MEIVIKYSTVRHWYARIWLDWILKLTIPNRLKNDDRFKNDLVEKWKKLYEKYKSKNLNKIEVIDQNNVLVFWEKVLITDIDWKLEDYLKLEIYKFSLPIIKNYSEKLWIPYNEISIKSMKSKWWSCSHDNKILLNQKLVHLHLKFLNYVCIHEVCHFKQKNHSKRFWNLVESFLPDYKLVRKELRNLVIDCN